VLLKQPHSVLAEGANNLQGRVKDVGSMQLVKLKIGVFVHANISSLSLNG